MAVTNFYVALNVKTSNGFQTFGKFFLGHDERFADAIFRKLRGSKRITKNTILNMEMTETRNELPQNIQMLSCTLEELTDNCKMITKETFKHFNLAEEI